MIYKKDKDCQKEKYASKNKYYYYGCRDDRYGSNAIPWIAVMFLSQQENVPLYHNCSTCCNRYKNNIIHKMLLTHSKTTNKKKLPINFFIFCILLHMQKLLYVNRWFHYFTYMSCFCRFFISKYFYLTLYCATF